MIIMIEEQIKQNIIKELGIGNLSAKKAEEVMVKLEENMRKILVLEVLDLLRTDDQQELMSIIETKNDKKVFSFLESKIVNFSSLIRVIAVSAVKEFKFSVG